MNGPRAYRRDGEQLTDKLTEYMKTQPDDPHFIKKSRRIAAEIRHFLLRWNGRVNCDEETFKLFETQSRIVEEQLEKLWLLALRKLLEARKMNLLWDALDVNFADCFESLDSASPEERARVLKAYRDVVEQDYAAETGLLPMEAKRQEMSEDFESELRIVRTHWGDRFDAAMEDRLKTTDVASLDAWNADVARTLAVFPEPF